MEWHIQGHLLTSTHRSLELSKMAIIWHVHTYLCEWRAVSIMCVESKECTKLGGMALFCFLVLGGRVKSDLLSRPTCCIWVFICNNTLDIRPQICMVHFPSSTLSYTHAMKRLEWANMTSHVYYRSTHISTTSWTTRSYNTFQYDKLTPFQLVLGQGYCNPTHLMLP